MRSALSAARWPKRSAQATALGARTCVSPSAASSTPTISSACSRRWSLGYRASSRRYRFSIRLSPVAVTLILRPRLLPRALASRGLAPRTAAFPSCRPSGQAQTTSSDGGVGAQTAYLGREFGGPFVGDPVVAAQPPVHDLLFVPGNQAIGLQPVQGRVQGARTEPDPAVGYSRHVGHDPVTVLGPRSQ